VFLWTEVNICATWHCASLDSSIYICHMALGFIGQESNESFIICSDLKVNFLIDTTFKPQIYLLLQSYNSRFVQKVSVLTTVHEVDKTYEVLTLIVFNTVPFRSYTLRPTLLPPLQTFWELLFRLRRITFDVLRCLKSVSFQTFLKTWE